ncbi:hypothetical protein BKA65DRAFT_567628 [Rhexocercosporidium sp. MPI-PUGE-AT-0058]|nr:hypothetical protein BKA65DRAFT_567628 [Rhexocercosporidium sp. MPI-PUGE-AT-0058]
MEDETGRQAACNRCRGQKLRCIGVINPIFKSRSRLQRSEIPCERCKRVKVVCYSIRPAPRRTLNSDANNGKTISFVPGSPPDPDGPPSVLMSPASPRSGSKAPRIDQSIAQNHQQTTSTGSEKSLEVEETASDVDASATGIGASAIATATTTSDGDE